VGGIDGHGKKRSVNCAISSFSKGREDGGWTSIGWNRGSVGKQGVEPGIIYRKRADHRERKDNGRIVLRKAERRENKLHAMVGLRYH